MCMMNMQPNAGMYRYNLPSSSNVKMSCIFLMITDESHIVIFPPLYSTTMHYYEGLININHTYIIMSHAIDILDHAIKGDPGGLSFLEQTSSIYVLDAATTPGRPTIYGWWNYLNDALNEVEAYEVEGRHDASPIDAHVRLLATITRRVARRPLASDRHLVSTCLANASMSHMSLLSDENLAQTLVKNNDELRERNMGRIAALVFDYSFHRRDSSNCSMMQSSLSISAFSDPIAMEQLCGIVAANAVASGHEAIRHLVSDWILPSIQTLPSLAVAAIMTHIAVEAMGKGCPAGTHDVMKSLAPSVFQRALGPILIDSLRESDEVGEDAMVDSSSGSGGGSVEHRTAALALRSVDSWCDANSIGAVKLTSIFTSSNVRISYMTLYDDSTTCHISFSILLFLTTPDKYSRSHSRCFIFKC